jgi:hypothetical protein
MLRNSGTRGKFGTFSRLSTDMLAQESLQCSLSENGSCSDVKFKKEKSLRNFRTFSEILENFSEILENLLEF